MSWRFFNIASRQLHDHEYRKTEVGGFIWKSTGNPNLLNLQMNTRYSIFSMAGLVRCAASGQEQERGPKRPATMTKKNLIVYLFMPKTVFDMYLYMTWEYWIMEYEAHEDREWKRSTFVEGIEQRIGATAADRWTDQRTMNVSIYSFRQKSTTVNYMRTLLLIKQI